MKSLREKIEQKGVTARHIAKMVGIHHCTLSKIISGKQSHVSTELANKLHSYLDSLNTDKKIS